MYGLRDSDIATINSLLAKYPQIEEAIIFGSRAKGTHRQGSDVDIALKGTGGHATALTVSAFLNQETLLPYFFDIVDYASIDNLALIEHIQRVGKIIYKR